MADFLEYVRRRKAQLRKEMQELEVAERVFRQAHGDDGEPVPAAKGPDLFEDAKEWIVRQKLAPKTIQQMVIQLLDEAYPGGYTALEILDHIKKRWKPDLERTSLSPQLTRLKGHGIIRNDKTRWFLVVHGEAGAPHDADASA